MAWSTAIALIWSVAGFFSVSGSGCGDGETGHVPTAALATVFAIRNRVFKKQV